MFQLVSGMLAQTISPEYLISSMLNVGRVLARCKKDLIWLVVKVVPEWQDL